MTTWKTSDGTMINYEVHGDPTHELPLLLLPGLLGAIETQWRPFLPALTPYYQVIMVDLRGHGRSENRSHDLRPEQMVSDLGELLDHLGLNRVHVAGFRITEVPITFVDRLKGKSKMNSSIFKEAFLGVLQMRARIRR